MNVGEVYMKFIKKIWKHYQKFAELMKWITSKIFMFLAFVTAVQVVTVDRSQVEAIIVGGVFMFLSIMLYFIMDTNIIVNRIARGDNYAENKRRSARTKN